MNNLRQDFDECVDYVQHADNTIKPSNQLKLELYGLFKQATQGVVSGAKPGMMDVINRAKYTAWESAKELSSEAAQQRYIDRIEALRTGGD